MIVNFEIPDHVAARLMDIADERDVKVRDLLGDRFADVVLAVLAENPRRPRPKGPVRTEASRRPIDPEEVRELVLAGTSDTDIAALLEVTTDRVRPVREKLGLPAQGHGGRRRKDAA